MLDQMFNMLKLHKKLRSIWEKPAWWMLFEMLVILSESLHIRNVRHLMKFSAEQKTPSDTAHLQLQGPQAGKG